MYVKKLLDKLIMEYRGAIITMDRNDWQEGAVEAICDAWVIAYGCDLPTARRDVEARAEKLNAGAEKSRNLREKLHEARTQLAELKDLEAQIKNLPTAAELGKRIDSLESLIVKAELS